MIQNRLWWMVATLAITAVAARAEPPEVTGNPKNGLSSAAFRRNAVTTNATALGILVTHPLNNDLLQVQSGYINQQLRDSNARAVMEDLVECALAPGSELRYEDPSHRVHVWSGQLGLCQRPGVAGIGNWGRDKPTETCLELVTACLMARVNELHKAIPISLHGKPAALFPSGNAVAAESMFRESPPTENPSEGTPIPGFRQSCPVGQDCGWVPALVGTCDRTGGPIRLAINDPETCATVRLRACAGIHGCVAPGQEADLPPGFGVGGVYSKHLVDKEGVCPATPLSFTCPTEAGVGGNYSIMLQRGEAAAPAISEVTQIAGTGHYPAPPDEAFRHVEGAFFGNLFDPSALGVTCDVFEGLELRCRPVAKPGANEPPPSAPPCPIDGGDTQCPRAAASDILPMPYRRAYACFSLAQEQQGNDELGAAYLNSRICDTPDPTATCFFHPPTRCYYPDPERNAADGAHCTWSEESGSFQRCRGPEATPFRPITVHLNDPCDLIGDHNVCARVRRAIDSRSSQGGRPDIRGPRGCCGCASHDGATLVPVLLAFGLLRRRRMRRVASAN